ncbi:hypothetical protein FA95DRAFT_1358700 [Auriscalpium vulgare]|uniref:Uncharacterized protein n=1 Tax=Auriscalpium vulgare TaxID=40419 RepID=A0ACB8RR93_9AGAM|nr:hypothetical protein FA95DRAFT_1358700 [Auriscalpium vulgare]
MDAHPPGKPTTPTSPQRLALQKLAPHVFPSHRRASKPKPTSNPRHPRSPLAPRLPASDKDSHASRSDQSVGAAPSDASTRRPSSVSGATGDINDLVDELGRQAAAIWEQNRRQAAAHKEQIKSLTASYAAIADSNAALVAELRARIAHLEQESAELKQRLAASGQ